MTRLSSSLLIPVASLAILAGTIVINDRGAADADADGRPTVVYAHPPCPPDLMRHFERAFDAFREQHPKINLKVLHVTGEYEDKIKVMFAGRVAPDVIFMYPTALAAWVDLGALLPLNDLVAADDRTGLDDYFPAAVRTFTYGGKVYGLPKDASASILIYNRRMFREHDLAAPSADWTWQDMLRAARVLTRDVDGNGTADLFGIQQPDWRLFVRQNGGQIVSDDGRRCVLDSPQAIEALKFWVALRQEHKVTPTPELTMDMTQWRLFALERTGMIVSMYPAVQILRRSCEFEWDIALLPRGPVVPYATFTGSALAVTAQSKHPEAAYEWVRWMTTEGMTHVMSFDIPAYVRLGASDAWQDPAEPPPSKQAAVETMKIAGPPLQHPAYAQILDVIDSNLDRANRGDCTVEQAVERIVPRVNAILDRYPDVGAGQ
jgi:multiple sugar transport system substrate-binding protein